MNWARRFFRHIGRRGTVLLFFGLLWFNTGISWVKVPPANNAGFDLIRQVVSYSQLGWMMVTIGSLMFISVFWKKLEDLSFASSAFLSIFLGLGVAATYLPGWPMPPPTAPRAIAIYFTYGLLVFVISGWPEPPVSSLPPEDDDDSE